MTRLLKYRTLVQNQSNTIIVHGKKGVGKSWLCLALAERLDKNFSIDNVVFSPLELFELLSKGVKRGSVIIYEEAGVGMNSRDAQTKSNKHISFLNQVWRTKNITVFFNTPLIGFVDKQLKSLFDFEIEPKGFDALSGISRFKFFVVYPSKTGGEPIRKHLIYSINGRLVKFVEWSCMRPSKDLAEAYEQKRNAFLDQVVLDGLSTVRTGKDYRFGKTRKVEKKPIDLMDISNKALAEVELYCVNGRPNAILIAKAFGLSMNYATNVCRFIKAELKTKKHTHIGKEIN